MRNISHKSQRPSQPLTPSQPIRASTNHVQPAPTCSSRQVILLPQPAAVFLDFALDCHCYGRMRGEPEGDEGDSRVWMSR